MGDMGRIRRMGGMGLIQEVLRWLWVEWKGGWLLRRFVLLDVASQKQSGICLCWQCEPIEGTNAEKIGPWSPINQIG